MWDLWHNCHQLIYSHLVSLGMVKWRIFDRSRSVSFCFAHFSGGMRAVISDRRIRTIYWNGKFITIVLNSFGTVFGHTNVPHSCHSLVCRWHQRFGGAIIIYRVRCDDKSTFSFFTRNFINLNEETKGHCVVGVVVVVVESSHGSFRTVEHTHTHVLIIIMFLLLLKWMGSFDGHHHT